MQRDEINKANDRPIKVLQRLSKCVCESGDIPCFKHDREAFEVYFYARYGRAPFDFGITLDGDRLRCWYPLTTRGYPETRYRDPRVGSQALKLLYRLNLPGRISEDYGKWGWCFYKYRDDSTPIARGAQLSEVARRYVQRARRPTWSRK